ncbi:hypothetical protein RchiOBHm_Chr7g0199311 [Rosa chinensis]|uniref:Uncharacterized protein n=1 Tax=Rosa chinensis TaxID=74649 RepID=A0A2P6P7C5_ROSCH|nr:hypothetical protein RchiOBHm_Chr7g0199311 [Rosa chinensis]
MGRASSRSCSRSPTSSASLRFPSMASATTPITSRLSILTPPSQVSKHSRVSEF